MKINAVRKLGNSSFEYIGHYSGICHESGRARRSRHEKQFRFRIRALNMKSAQYNVCYYRTSTPPPTSLPGALHGLLLLVDDCERRESRV